MVEKQDKGSVSELLAELEGGQADAAWRSFIDAYATTITGIVNRYALEPDQASDCFLFVCEKLCEREFHRLLQFDPKRGASFRTWLIAIVSNLCVDWHRGTHGRQVTPAAIQQMPELERWVYHFHMELGMDLESCLRAMRARFPELGRSRFSKSIAAIHRALSPKQRWGILVRRNRRELPEVEAETDTGDAAHSPAAAAQHTEMLDSLRTALSRLPPQQRMVLRLRYEQDLTLEEVARIAGLNDLHQARRLIQTALAELEKIMQEQGFTG